MFFTREDILKIQNILLQVSVKDSELPIAGPITGDNSLALVQEGKNKQINLKDLFSQISLWKGEEDFINITAKYNKGPISLSEAINTIPKNQRKNGIVITFQDTNNEWKLYQFKGDITNFSNEANWTDLLDIKEGAVGTNEIAEEVWAKLQDEYLKVNGSNKMKADLNMNRFSLDNTRFIKSSKSDYPTYYLQNYINLYDEYGGISFVIGNSDSTSPNIECSMNENGEWIATGFKTTNQSSFGLLGNEGSVVTAMTDSDINKYFAIVFG